MTSRARFEQWYSNNGESPNAVARSANGHFMLMQTQISWIAWAVAERDMLDRCIALFDTNSRTQLHEADAVRQLKELLNEPR
jgi:hypothetical protein